MPCSTGSESVLEHLKQRGLNPNLYATLWTTDEVAVFWLTDFSGKITGFHQYRPAGNKKVPNCLIKSKYANYIPKGETALLGVESLVNPGPVILVSGLFKAATLHRLGYAALHVSGTSYKVLKPQLYALARPFFAVGDLDDEGAQFVRRYGGFQSQDFDELPDEEVHKCLLKM